jgi:hypothetical protein
MKVVGSCCSAKLAASSNVMRQALQPVVAIHGVLNQARSLFSDITVAGRESRSA